MSRSIQRPLPPMEVNRVDDGREPRVRTVNDVDRLAAVPLAMARARVGQAVTRAIGSQPLKAFGDKGLVSKVCSGEKVPDYLARIHQCKETRRRFALALLEDDTDVIVTTTITVPHSKKVG